MSFCRPHCESGNRTLESLSRLHRVPARIADSSEPRQNATAFDIITLQAQPARHGRYSSAFLAGLTIYIINGPFERLNAIFTAPSKDTLHTMLASVGCTEDSFLIDDKLTRCCNMLVRFLAEIRGGTSQDTVIYAVMLLWKLRKARESTGLGFGDLQPWTVVAVMLAWKFLCESELSVRHWSGWSGVKSSVLTMTERWFLEDIEYRVWIRDDEFKKLKYIIERLWRMVLDPGEG